MKATNCHTIQLPRSLAALRWLLFLSLGVGSCSGVFPADAQTGWTLLFDGKSLQGWRAWENADTWRVEEGLLVGHGARSHLFYEGPVGDHDFRNFELVAEVRAKNACNSGVYFHTAYQQSGWPSKGYEVQINNGSGGHQELERTGSLDGVRNVYSTMVADGEWFEIRIRVASRRVCVWVNGQLTVDYIEPKQPVRGANRAGRVLSDGTIALQVHDAKSQVAFRKVAIRLLGDNIDSSEPARASDQGYGVKDNLMDSFAAAKLPVIDFHIHLRGEMTVEKAIMRQAVTGVNVGVLRNIGAGWPIETDQQLSEFLDSVGRKPVFVGLQVNDRDWMSKHSKTLLDRLDFILADTMIMPMPRDESEPVKLWISDGYKIDDPEAWMERYMRHNLRVLAEPVTILANPTYLPPPVEHLYDQLWTDDRMRTLIDAAIENDVALEINARSGLPRDRFIRMAKQMGAKFSFGTNNFDDKPIDMTRCFESIDLYGLKQSDMYVPPARQ